MNKQTLTIVLLLGILIFNNHLSNAFTDNYPKNPLVDAVNYAFKIDLSDVSDEIVCEVNIDIRYLGAGVNQLRLDLINKSAELDGKGMEVSSVTTNGKEISYSHKNDELLIDLQSSYAGSQTACQQDSEMPAAQIA